MKNKINTVLIALMLCTPMLALNGCTKESPTEESPIEDPIRPKNISAEKFERIKKFVAIMWCEDGQFPKDFKYNPETDEFTFGKVIISNSLLEHAYDIANEYKLNHEQ